MAERDDTFMHEQLKKIQAGIAGLTQHSERVEANIADLTLRTERVEEQLSSIRHILVAMQTGDLHQEATVAALRVDVDAIKQHLHLPKN
jgi:chromosome segregation ATPase